MATKTYTVTATSAGAKATTTATVAGKSITPPTDVSAVGDLTVANTTNDTMHVTWTWEQGGGKPVTSWEIRYRTPAGSGTWSAVQTENDETAREYTLTGLKPGTTYEVEVVAVNAGPPVVKSTSVTVTGTTDNVVPAPTVNPVTGLQVRTSTTNSITVQWVWDKGTNLDATRFEVQWRVSGGSWSTAAQRPPTDRSYTVSGLTAGTAYEIRVVAVNITSGDRTESTAVSIPAVTQTNTGTVQSIYNLQETTHTTTSIAVSWNWDQGTGLPIDNFEITYRTPAGSGPWSTPVTTSDATARAYTVTGLNPDTEYEIRVVAVRTSTPSPGRGNGASIIDRTPSAQGPQVPTNLKITEAGTPDTPSHEIHWTWDPPAAGPTPDGYQLEWGEAWGGSSFSSSIENTSAGNRYFGLTNASSGAVYRGRVRSKLGSQWSTWTDWVTLTTTSTKVDYPRNLRNDENQTTTTSLTFTWYHPTSGLKPDGFKVQYRETGSGTWIDAPDVMWALPQPFTAKIGSLKPNTGYDLRVRAYSGSTTGDWTTPASGITAGASGGSAG
ncbi:fibronectin type III domain-containing protein [Kitasatospora sp. NPDC056076]|uniref:fibronectin type III domain-containing protein n=1 Tax=Kitasatospora sp. NPDC056076 TaxID=3345703 RepID=UPI0035DCC7A9